MKLKKNINILPVDPEYQKFLLRSWYCTSQTFRSASGVSHESREADAALIALLIFRKFQHFSKY